MEGQALSFPFAAAEAGALPAIELLPPEPVALLVHGHGAGAGMRHASQQSLAEAFYEQGLATFRYEFPFMAEGRRRVDRQAVSEATVRAVADFARQRFPDLPVFLSGHSYGGRMATHAVLEPFDGWSPAGLILCSFPLHTAGKPAVSRAAHLSAIDAPILFLSGTRDALAERTLMNEMVGSLGSRARLHWLETADHSYKVLKRSRTSSEDVFVEIARHARSFVDRCIADPG